MHFFILRADGGEPGRCTAVVSYLASKLFFLGPPSRGGKDYIKMSRQCLCHVSTDDLRFQRL